MVDLVSEFDRLNPEQKRAVRTDGNTVVLAGPGSGKTDTLVIKVVHLLSSQVTPPRGLACITFNNDAVHEFQQRLSEFGIYASSRVFLGTAHSFCFNCIVRTFGPVVSPTFARDLNVAPPRHADNLLRRAIEKYLPYTDRYYATTITRYRRARVCGEDLSGFDDHDPLIVQEYLKSLSAEGLIDFEGMIAEALNLIERQPAICAYVAARFPWLLVDEYQDLGGPLHRLVVCLVEHADIKVFAVGDPDQTVYDFTGANPRYLLELADRQDFETIRLRFNYRSGKRLILASEAALSPPEPRNYQPDPKRLDPGEVYFEDVEGGYDAQARAVARSIIPQLDKQGIRREEIAILYRSSGRLFQAVRRELTEAGVPFSAERDGLFPRSPFVRWLQRAAGWGVADVGSSIEFDELIEPYSSWLQQAGLNSPSGGGMEARKRLYEFLTQSAKEDLRLDQWIEAAKRELQLTKLLTLADLPDSVEDLETLLTNARAGGTIETFTVADFARDGKMVGRIRLTTLHSSKGRQFDAVIMPGMQEAVLPARSWDSRRRAYAQPSPRTMREDRRLFYVGFTRARRFVFLLFSPTFINDRGYPVREGPSRFVQEIRRRLEAEEGVPVLMPGTTVRPG